MFIIGEAVVQDDVAEARFSCDLKKCKGACCTMQGERGAPLLDEEILYLQTALPFASEYLNKKHRKYIKKHNFFSGAPGDFTTACIDGRECVFVYYDSGIARCSLERAFNEGKTTWKKPISCHLFPIRILNGKPAMVRYERIPECSAGIEKGEREGTDLLEFLEEPLRRRFGDEWYTECTRVKI